MNPVIDKNNELLSYAAMVCPLKVIVLIFNNTKLQNINAEMSNLLKAAIPQCGTKKEQAQLRNFQKWQEHLFSALHTVYVGNNLRAGGENKIPTRALMAFKQSGTDENDLIFITQDPTKVIQRLLKRCPASYARIRLWDWMDRGLSNNSFYKSNIERNAILYYYQLCAALIAAANSLNNSCIDN